MTLERGQGDSDPLSDEVSDQEINLAEDEKEPDQDHDSLDETWQCKDGTGRGWRCVSSGRSSVAAVGAGDGYYEADLERNFGLG